jgi:uncharacterized protein (TIGR03437 family)
MTRMFKNLFILAAATIVVTAGAAHANAQNFDTSGTAAVNGQYLFRYVNHFNDQNGNLTESCSLTGVITFDGKGVYTLSNTQLYDSAGTSAGSCSSLGGGTYGVQSNGMAQLDNPMFAATLYGAVSAPVITASSTEDDYYDLFVAVQTPTSPFSNSSLKGAYTVGSLEFPNVATAGTSLTHQAYFTMTADGNGGISPITLTGSAANLNGTNITQTVSGATYTISGATGGTLNIPNTTNSQLVSGTKLIYISSDGNYIVGGSTSGADMIFGFRAATSPSNSLISGTYFTSGLDANVSSGFLDAFYGSINANGAGTFVWHERFDDVVDVATYDNTFSSSVTIGSNGSFFDGTYTTLVGFNGKAGLIMGSGQQFSLNIMIQAPSFTPTPGVWINPIGVTNAANFTPITNAYAPGELVNIYGNFGVSTQVDQVSPIPPSLNGVQVLINGTAAPVYLTSNNQITALVPYAVAADYFATFQVVVNGTKSNSVTVYSDLSAPAIYTTAQTGLGTSALLHANNTLVTDSNPAMPGETVSLFLNGLGTVTPAVADGAAGSSNPLSYADGYQSGNFGIFIDDGVDYVNGFPPQAKVTFAGLAPGIAGLYQVNFTLPSATRSLGNGHAYIIVNTLEAETEMALISLGGYAHSSSVATVPSRQAATSMARTRVAAASNGSVAGAAHSNEQSKRRAAAGTKDTRRALPPRIVE